MKNRFSPLKIREKILKNRVVVPPMASQTALSNGEVSEMTLNHYQRLAEASPGLLIVEYSYVQFSGKSEENQLAIDHDDKISGLKKLAIRIQDGGALAGIQLTHAGGKTHSHLTGGILLGPSDVAVPVKAEILEKPQMMSLEKINEMKLWYLNAARRAVAAGFDLIEIHAAHGYGLNQWLSPITNKRQDLYGGDLRARARLLLEIIDLIRKNFSNILLSVRMPGQDFFEGGLKTEDAIAIAILLEQAGVDVLHISSGIGGWRRPLDRQGEGYLVNEAKKIAEYVKIPVIGVGGIQTAAYIDAALSDGAFSLAAIGRAILSDPAKWRKSQMMCSTSFAGSEQEIVQRRDCN